jgi:hypothetical protein
MAGVEPSATGPAVRAAIEAALATDHLCWLEGCSYALASLVLEPREVVEANRWARYIQTGRKDRGEDWFDPQGRWAIAGPTGVGKTVVATSFLAEMVERYEANGCRIGPGVRGALYCASSVDLLSDAWRQLRDMGACMDHVALIHSEDEDGPAEIAVTESGALKDYPVVLCTQQRIKRLSVLNQTRTKQGEAGSLLLQILEFQGKDRCGLWDEAFHSADIAALTHKQVASAAALVKTEELAAAAKAEGRADAVNAAEQLQQVHRRLAAARSGVSRSAVANRMGRELEMGPVDVRGFLWIEEQLRKAEHTSAAETVRVLRDMSASYLKVFSVPPVTKDAKLVHLVQPVAKVDPLLKRVVVLDASYRVSLLSASDHTVKESRRLACSDIAEAGTQLVPKRFDRALVTLCRGPSGRSNMEKDRKLRRGMIQRQVSRILRFVPTEEPFLICTFKDRDIAKDEKNPGTDDVRWIEEIQQEMDRQGVSDSRKRASFVTWGRHKGRNCWRHIKYGFAFGVTQRVWSGDLHLKTKALEGDLVNIGQTVVPNAQADGPSAEIAADLQQLIGRLCCRNTTRVVGEESGQSGETFFWMEMYDPGSRRGLSLDGLIPTRLREAMPGIRFAVGEGGKVAAAKAPTARVAPTVAPSEQQFMDAALVWVAGYQGEALNTAVLTAAVREKCADLAATVNPKTLKRGIAKAKQRLLDDGQWEAATSRTLIRLTAPSPLQRSTP